MYNSNIFKVMLFALVLQASGVVKAVGKTDPHEDEINLATALSISTHADEETLNAILAISAQSAKEEEKKRQDDKVKAELKMREDQIALDFAIASVLAADFPAEQPAQQPAQAPVAPAPAATEKPKTDEPKTSEAPKKQACNICFDDKEEKDFVKLSCGHSFCKTCLEGGVLDLAIREKRTNDLVCPEPKCKKAISDEDIAKITKDEGKIKELGEIKFRELMIKDPHAKQCPTPNCSFIFINPNQRAQKFNCPQCKKDYCSNCLYPHLTTVTCAKAKEDRDLAGDKDKANKAADDWIKKNTKPCPHCNAKVQKDGGCRFIDCGSCKQEFCWICLAKTPHKHANHGCPAGDGYHMVYDNDHNEVIF